MKNMFPKTKLGKLAVILIAMMPVLFALGGILTNVIYQGVPAGGAITSDLAARPFLAVSMLTGIVSGVAAFVLGLIAYFKQGERSRLIYLPLALGLLLVFFLIGELFPH